MNKLDEHEFAGCQEGPACTGPGCRVSTGKTQRKKNWLRPKYNQHEADGEARAKRK